MKLLLLSITLMIICFSSCKKDCPVDPAPTEKTITLQPGPNEGNDAYVILLDSDPSSGNTNQNNNPDTFRELSALAWTNGGAPVMTRSYLSFNLSTLPANAEIISAKLSLYGLASSVLTPQGNSGLNIIQLQRVLDNWTENTVTWNNQPMTTFESQIELPATTSTFNFNYIDVNVAGLIEAMKCLSPDKTAGFCIRLKDESAYKSLVLASSEHEDASRRPKLEIVYKN